jgi:ABC-type nitrate/sulfonate/bicarbonate transport system substrate-binding protein
VSPLKGHILADTTKEVQLVWNGVAVSSKLLAENPRLVERFLRAVAKGREFARRYKEPTIAMIAKHNPSPSDVLSLDYETVLGSMTEAGWVADDVLRDEIVTRGELIKVARLPEAPVSCLITALSRKSMPS